MTQISFELQARQQTTLTPRLQQSVKLLQMSTLDFSREVAEAIANNPFLEEQEDSSAMPEAASSAPDSEHEHASSSPASPSGDEQESMPATQQLGRASGRERVCQYV